MDWSGEGWDKGQVRDMKSLTDGDVVCTMAMIEKREWRDVLAVVADYNEVGIGRKRRASDE